MAELLIQQDPALKRRLALAQAMAQQSMSAAPVKSPWEALTRIGTAYFAKKGMEGAEGEQKAKEKAAYAKLAEAFSPQITSPGLPSPDPNLQTQSRDRSIEEMARILSQNPDTASLGVQLQLQSATGKAKTQRALELERLKANLRNENTQALLKNLPGGDSVGTSYSVGPQGLSVNVDPSKRDKLDLDRRRHFWETGDPAFAPSGQDPSGQPPGGTSGLPPKQSAEVAKKRAEEAPAASRRVESARRKAAIVSKKVDDALKQVGFFTTGLTGKVLSFVPGRDAYNLDKTIDTIKANIGFQELQAMREASPTGGALGQVAVKELDFLQAAIASLDLGQDDDVLIENLKAVKTHFENWKKAVEESYRQTYGGEAKGDTPSIDDLLRKYGG